MRQNSSRTEFDYILVGGGLQSGLLALALEHHHPDCSVLMIERNQAIGGNHTWSFHCDDVPESSRSWFNPFVLHRWPGYQVRLGNFRRDVPISYATIPSDHFERTIARMFARATNQKSSIARTELQSSPGKTAASVAVMEPPTATSDSPRWQLMTGVEVSSIHENHVRLNAGEIRRGKLVIDCRGPSRAAADTRSGCGFQTFYGLEVELPEDWPHERPIVMDSLSNQSSGFQFLYSLPFDRRRVLIEDTHFGDEPSVDPERSTQVISEYLASRGIRDWQVVRKEYGVLPMPYASIFRPQRHSPLAGGYAGGWFHAATGYSVPMAVAFAEAVAGGPIESAGKRVDQLANEHHWRAGYSRFLNRLLFRLVAPRHRHQIFRRFYRVLDDQAVARFYAHRFTARDAFRIVVGIPPTLAGLRPWRMLCSYFTGDK